MRILLADDHEIVREGLRACLQADSRYEVVGEADDGTVVVRLAAELKPDLVVMDVAMPGLDGIEAARQILAASHGAVKVLVLSMHSNREVIGAAFRAGVSGYLVKSSAFREFVQALEDISRGKTYISPAVADLVIEHFVRTDAAARPNADAALTPRELRIVQMLAEGYSAKQIGGALDISHKTVHALRAQVMGKIKAKSIVDLVKYALRHELTQLK